MLAQRSDGFVLTIAEIHNQANSFSARTLYLVGLVVEKLRNGEITQKQYEESLEQIANSTSNPRLLKAFALFHPTNIISDKGITVQF
jgi:hypothetical protein